ncbi:MAG: biotin transporter BioY [Clostridiales bacterium]|jgi:biotin transport system substrate-specific component|nr:biotin transporter BioY [Clostridiales bacterium]
MKKRVYGMVLISLFSALTAAGAFIKIPLPYFDYITLQTLTVLLSGMILGAEAGAAAVTVYVLIGLCGVPVFAGGGGIDYALRPSFGYLAGFILAAAVIGKLLEKSKRKSYKAHVIAGLLGLAALYLPGIIYRYIILNAYMNTGIPLSAILLTSVTIEIPKDILVCIFASWLAVRIKSALRR